MQTVFTWNVRGPVTAVSVERVSLSMCRDQQCNVHLRKVTQRRLIIYQRQSQRSVHECSLQIRVSSSVASVERERAAHLFVELAESAVPAHSGDDLGQLHSMPVALSWLQRRSNNRYRIQRNIAVCRYSRRAIV